MWNSQIPSKGKPIQIKTNKKVGKSIKNKQKEVNTLSLSPDIYQITLWRHRQSICILNNIFCHNWIKLWPTPKTTSIDQFIMQNWVNYETFYENLFHAHGNIGRKIWGPIFSRICNRFLWNFAYLLNSVWKSNGEAFTCILLEWKLGRMWRHWQK